MCSILKYCFGKQQIRNVCSRLFRRNIRNSTSYNNYYSLTQKLYKSRAISSQKLLKPTVLTYPAEDKEEFYRFLPIVIKDLTEDETYSNIPEATKRFYDVLHYHLPNGSNVLGLTTLYCYKMLEKPQNLTADNIKLASAMAWSVELVCVSTLILDDIWDNSETRRNAPCWFRVDGIGLSAINDANFLQNSAFTILKKYLSSHPLYTPILELVLDTHLKITYGQCFDNIKPQLEQITLDRFNRCAFYKSAYFIYFAPIILGMYLTNNYSAEIHRKITPILLELGSFFAVENDMWDCFGDENRTGKDGTDIQEGKCTWPAAVALQKANLVQRQVMIDHYGRPSKKSIELIRQLYEELDLHTEFSTFKRNSQKRVHSQIQELSMSYSMRYLLFALADKLYNRIYE